ELEPGASPASASAGGALLGRGVSGAGRDDLRRRSQRLERKLVRITSRRRSRDLDLDAHHAGERVSLESIRAALPADAVLVEYYEARGTVYAFVLGRDRLEVRPVTTSERVRRLLGFLRFQLSKLQLGDAYVATFAEPLLLAARSHLGDLHRELIAPVRRWLEGRSLVVVPHGPLH